MRKTEISFADADRILLEKDGTVVRIALLKIRAMPDGSFMFRSQTGNRSEKGIGRTGEGIVNDTPFKLLSDATVHLQSRIARLIKDGYRVVQKIYSVEFQAQYDLQAEKVAATLKEFEARRERLIKRDADRRAKKVKDELLKACGNGAVVDWF